MGPVTDVVSSAELTEMVEEAVEEADEEVDTRSFAELLGPDCVIKRVDKDKNVLSAAKPEEMQAEMMSMASAQKRLGACADHVKDMSRDEKLRWALDLKDRANEFYAASNFEEAAKLYSDCLVALDLNGSKEENAEIASKLQLPVCTNLAACMIESAAYPRCIEICDLALSVDPESTKALYRRGLARYRMGDHAGARPDFEAAMRALTSQREAGGLGEEEVRSLDDVHRRLTVYLGQMRRFAVQEKSSCKKMFDQPLYSDRPDPKPEAEKEEPWEVDDSDEAIEAAIERIEGSWGCCRCLCRRRQAKQKQKMS